MGKGFNIQRLDKNLAFVKTLQPWAKLKPPRISSKYKLLKIYMHIALLGV